MLPVPASNFKTYFDGDLEVVLDSNGRSGRGFACHVTCMGPPCLEICVNVTNDCGDPLEGAKVTYSGSPDEVYYTTYVMDMDGEGLGLGGLVHNLGFGPEAPTKCTVYCILMPLSSQNLRASTFWDHFRGGMKQGFPGLSPPFPTYGHEGWARAGILRLEPLTS